MIKTSAEAAEIIFSLIKDYGTEEISVRDSFKRVLAEDIHSLRDYPDRRKSAIDGYAFRHGRKTYRIMGDIPAGDVEKLSVKEDEAYFVMTGGVVPDGADCVARIEDCTEDGDTVSVPEKAKPGELINSIGEECRSGDIVAQKGSVIDKTLYPVLFYQGLGTVKVYRQPKIGAFVTGDEILEAGDEYKPGMVYNTNRYILESALKELHLGYEMYGNVADTEGAVSKALQEMTEKYDVIFTSGGISMGKYDFVKKVFNEQGYNVHFQRTRVKPGSPLMIAEKSGKLFIGMPGYPAAFASNLYFYIIPALKKACGVTGYENMYVDMVLETPFKPRKGRTDISRAVVSVRDGKYFASDPGQMTSHFNNFAAVNGFVIFDSETDRAEKGDIFKGIIL